MYRRVMSYIYLGLAWLFVAGILAQVFFAGMGIFSGRPFWNTHTDLGHGLGLFPLLMLLVAGFGRLGRGLLGRTALVLLTYILLADVVIFVRDPAFVAALHPVAAVVLFTLALSVARRAGSTRLTADEGSMAPSAEGAGGS